MNTGLQEVCMVWFEQSMKFEGHLERDEAEKGEVRAQGMGA